ncbi:MAG: diaminopimelate decarboxylase family protein [Gammaproteobacteria bacterium]
MRAFVLKRIGDVFVSRSLRRQQNSRVRDLALWGLGVNTENHLAVDGVDAVDLLARYGSPLMVVNKKRLVEDALSIKNALSQTLPGSRVLYSYKTNCIPAILAEIHKLGIGAEVISPFELWLAEQLGNRGEDIVFNGVAKTEESLRRALELDVVAVNIDHPEEFDKLLALHPWARRRIRIGLRLGLSADSQFGLDVESGEAMGVCRRIASLPHLFDLVAVHFNVVSNAHDNGLHRRCLARALDFVLQIKHQIGLDVAYLNIGGGYGVPTTKVMSRFEYAVYRLFGALPRPPEPMAYQSIDVFLGEIGRDIRRFCRGQGLREPKLLVEPGRYITSRSQFLLTRINAIKKKHDGRLYALTDAGKISITYPCDYEYHEIFVANRMADSLTTNYTVVGRTCTAADWMVKNRCLPSLQAGDVLAVMDAGAYFVSYSTNFAFPRPAVVLVSDGKPQLVRRAESFRHMVGMDIDLTPITGGNGIESASPILERRRQDLACRVGDTAEA